MSEVREFAVEHNPRGCSEPSTRVHIRGGTRALKCSFSGSLQRPRPDPGRCRLPRPAADADAPGARAPGRRPVGGTRGRTPVAAGPRARPHRPRGHAADAAVRGPPAHRTRRSTQLSRPDVGQTRQARSWSAAAPALSPLPQTPFHGFRPRCLVRPARSARARAPRGPRPRVSRRKTSYRRVRAG